MPTHKLTKLELEILRKLSNSIYDIIRIGLETSDERADSATEVAIKALTKHLEEGN